MMIDGRSVDPSIRAAGKDSLDLPYIARANQFHDFRNCTLTIELADPSHLFD